MNSKSLLKNFIKQTLLLKEEVEEDIVYRDPKTQIKIEYLPVFGKEDSTATLETAEPTIVNVNSNVRRFLDDFIKIVRSYVQHELLTIKNLYIQTNVRLDQNYLIFSFYGLHFNIKIENITSKDIGKEVVTFERGQSEETISLSSISREDIINIVSELLSKLKRIPKNSIVNIVTRLKKHLQEVIKTKYSKFFMLKNIESIKDYSFNAELQTEQHGNFDCYYTVVSRGKTISFYVVQQGTTEEFLRKQYELKDELDDIVQQVHGGYRGMKIIVEDSLNELYKKILEE